MALRHSLKALVKGFQRPFSADSVAEKHGDKIDHFVAPKTATGKTHLFFDGSKHPLPLQVVRQQRDFSEPVRNRGDRLSRGLDIHRGIGDSSH